jgi:hypothetical protein
MRLHVCVEVCVKVSHMIRGYDNQFVSSRDVVIVSISLLCVHAKSISNLHSAQYIFLSTFCFTTPLRERVPAYITLLLRLLHFVFTLHFCFSLKKLTNEIMLCLREKTPTQNIWFVWRVERHSTTSCAFVSLSVCVEQHIFIRVAL